METSTSTAGEAAYLKIREWILAGRLAPGQRLNQNRLADELGMSRIPVRDALSQLSADGLVALRANASATVTPLSTDDLQELYELRLAIEPHLCRVAVPRVNAEDLDEMEAVLHRMDQMSDHHEWQALNNEFHAILYNRSGRVRSIEIVQRIRHQTDRYTRIYRELDQEAAHAEHGMMLDACRKGEAARLEALVRAHLAAGYEAMLAYLGERELQRTEAPQISSS